jgi:hypothetical protein
MQGHRRTGVRARAALVTVVADRRVVATPDGPVDEWPLGDCAVRADEPRIGGLRLPQSFTVAQSRCYATTMTRWRRTASEQRAGVRMIHPMNMAYFN